MIYEYTKAAYIDQLTIEIKGNANLAPTFQNVSALGTALKIQFSGTLSVEDEATLSSIVTAHTGITSTQSLTLYLDGVIFPFVKNLINTFAAENISMGITQAGKSGEVLGLFEMRYTVAGISRPVSLKASFDTGSLYVSRQIIQHVRDNPTEYDGLSPFVTDARLLAMKNKIEAQLGLPLST
jgi:hypothetical protein